jgi:hypothetical protein
MDRGNPQGRNLTPEYSRKGAKAQRLRKKLQSELSVFASWREDWLNSLLQVLGKKVDGALPG